MSLRGDPCERFRFALPEREHETDEPLQTVAVIDHSRLIDLVAEFRIIQADVQKLGSVVDMGDKHRKPVPEHGKPFPPVGAAVHFPFSVYQLHQFLIDHSLVSCYPRPRCLTAAARDDRCYLRSCPAKTEYGSFPPDPISYGSDVRNA